LDQFVRGQNDAQQSYAKSGKLDSSYVTQLASFSFKNGYPLYGKLENWNDFCSGFTLKNPLEN
jgi:hypothetical protein